MVHVIKTQHRVPSGSSIGSDQSRGSRPEPLTVRIPEAVRMTGTGRSKLYELIQSGDLAIVKIGSATLIPVESLHQLISRNRRD